MAFWAVGTCAKTVTTGTGKVGESSSWRSFLRGCFPGVGADLGDPTHRGRQNQMDRSMLCRRSLVNCRGPAPADPGYLKERRRRRGSGNNCLITL